MTVTRLTDYAYGYQPAESLILYVGTDLFFMVAPA